MCGRSSLFEEPEKLLEAYGLPARLDGFIPRYNIAPSQDQWALIQSQDGNIQTRQLRWGLIPSWTSDPSIGSRMINARAESIAEKPAYRDALRWGRCLILADGYYEWKKSGTAKAPFRFQMSDRRPFVFAGLWDRWEKGEQPVESCTVITTQASPVASQVHNRMPVILSFEDSIKWIHPDARSSELLPLLRSYANNDLETYAVSRAVNNAANDSAECIQPANAPDTSSAGSDADESQTSFGFI